MARHSRFDVPVLALSVLALLVCARAAQACIDPHACICAYAPLDAAVRAHVISAGASGGTGVAQLDTELVVNGQVAQLPEGATVSTSLGLLDAQLKVGDSLLGTLQAKALQPQIRIDADGRVTCTFQPAFRPTAVEAQSAMAAANCAAALNALGFTNPPCNDTIAGTACSAARQGDFSAWAVPLVLGILVLRRRGKRGAA